MISYIKGAITYKNPTYILVEAGGIGYHVNISLQTYAKVEKLETVKILTYLHVREDAQVLYGFAEEVERAMFRHLISVSGIGTNTARVLLSGMDTVEVRSAIIAEDVRAFNKVKGIGPKTAKRIILDLKDKIIKEVGEVAPNFSPVSNTVRDEAISALVALGFNKIKVQKVVNKILKENPSVDKVENLLKFALKQM